MFVENYRLDTMMGGRAQNVIPYPKISDPDWQRWKAFLPVKSVVLTKKSFRHDTKNFLHTAYGIPPDVCREIVRGAGILTRSRFGASVRYAKTPLQWVLQGTASAI
jgi:hypothetical protein